MGERRYTQVKKMTLTKSIKSNTKGGLIIHLKPLGLQTALIFKIAEPSCTPRTHIVKHFPGSELPNFPRCNQTYFHEKGPRVLASGSRYSCGQILRVIPGHV